MPAIVVLGRVPAYLLSILAFDRIIFIVTASSATYTVFRRLQDSS
jgi:hypothetical protein